MSDNPFATRYIRPGALAFECAGANSPDQVFERLVSNRWHGAIVGPHGVGKSTLVEALLRKLEQRDMWIYHVGLHDGERRLPDEAFQAIASNIRSSTQPRVMLVVDGYEQLALLERWRLRRKIRASGAGILITAHAATRWPTIAKLLPSVEISEQVAARLLVREGWRFDCEEIAACYDRAGGNIRETLFLLYDRYEARNPANPSRS